MVYFAPVLPESPVTDAVGLPPEPDPSVAPLTPDPLQRPMSAAEVEEWRGRIQAAKDALKPKIEEGRRNVESYLSRLPNPGGPMLQVKVPADVWNTDHKTAQLLYREPDIQLTPRNLVAVQAQPLTQQVLNDYLGPEGVNILPTMRQVLFDKVNAVAFGAVKVWVEIITKPAPTGETGMDGLPVMVDAPFADKFAVDRIPPGRCLFPAEFFGPDYNKADWVGFVFEKNVPPNTPNAVSASDDDMLLAPRNNSGRGNVRSVLRGVEIWYRTRVFDPTELDPDHVSTFVLMDNETTPSEHRQSPFQRIGQSGRIEGMKDFPVRVLKTRFVSDTQEAPSDAQVTRPLVDEQSVGRTQVLQARDRNLPRYGYDSNVITDETMAKVVQNVNSQFIGVPGFNPSLFAPFQQAHIAQENPAFNQLTERDIEKAWGFGGNQLGVQAQTGQTATESSITQSNVDVTLSDERDAISKWYCYNVAAPLLTLLQMFHTADGWVRIIGPEGAQSVQQWNAGLIQGEFSFGIKQNSQLRPDAAADFKRITDVVNFAAKSPFVVQIELWREFMRQAGFDPSKVVTQPPPAQPELGEGFDWKCLDETLPTYANVWAILTARGFKGLTPPAMTLGAGHGAPQQLLTDGSAPEADKLDKHAADETGELPGGGSMVAAQTRQMVN